MIYSAAVAAVLAGLLLLAWRWRIYPAVPMALMALFPLAGTLAVPFVPGTLWLVLALDLGLGIVALLDLLSLPRRDAFSLRRQLQRVASLGKPHPVRLEVVNLSRRTYFVHLRDDGFPELEARPEQFSFSLPGESRVVLRYQLRARRRGAFTLQWVYLRVPSKLMLWQRLLVFPQESQLHVYPDMQQLGQYALLARTNRLALLGLRRTRRVGQDNEFERLRDYTQDDNYRHIDWRATARRRKLTVKQFQSNQSQTVVFLVDCGRMMVNRSSGLSLLDHALNSLLMLSYVALEHGDNVGLLCFSDSIHSFVPPGRGRQQMNRLIHACFDQFPRICESRYDEAFLYLQRQCRKRTLVVLITNLIDELNAELVGRHLTSVAGRHLPLAVLLRDPRLFEPLQVPDPARADLFRSAAAADIVLWRHQVLTTWQSRGILHLDVLPEHLTAPLVNRYLEIKARHLL